MEHSLPTEAVVRPWRRATVVASLIAAVELVVIVFAGMALFAKPFINRAAGGGTASRPAATRAVAKPAAAAAHPAKAVRHAAAAAKLRPLPKAVPVAKLHLARAQTPVAVLNGFGVSGAAGAAAARVRAHGYPVVSVANARKMDSPRTMVMYGAGLRAEGLRLAHDLHVGIVSPLDGVRPADLRGAKVVVLVGR